MLTASIFVIVALESKAFGFTAGPTIVFERLLDDNARESIIVAFVLDAIPSVVFEASNNAIAPFADQSMWLPAGAEPVLPGSVAAQPGCTATSSIRCRSGCRSGRLQIERSVSLRKCEVLRGFRQ